MVAAQQLSQGLLQKQQVAAVPAHSSDEELWWERVTEAYRLLWQQARLQQLQSQPVDA